MTPEVILDKVYLAGPMSGIARFNIPAFDAATKDLRATGREVISPAELDSPEDRAAAYASPDGGSIHYTHGKTWGDFLARDIKLIADTPLDGIFVLPGWEKSDGARLETFVGRALKHMPVRRYNSALPYGDGGEVGALDLVRAWAGLLWGAVIDRIRDNLTGILIGRDLA